MMFLTDVEDDDCGDIQPGRYYKQVWTHKKYHVLYLAYLDVSKPSYFGPTETQRAVVFQDKVTMRVYVRDVEGFRKLYRPTDRTIGHASFVPTPYKVQRWLDECKRGISPGWWTELHQREGSLCQRAHKRLMQLLGRVT